MQAHFIARFALSAFAARIKNMFDQGCFAAAAHATYHTQAHSAEIQRNVF
jgi:hypothetical protein